ncbi:hypothetical protein SCHPADRAFT_996134 [Schizopora paradoxa]|uniref:MYND-type domain-containing protein n=1 Tax=Schizopora paradoxa TaxID=27342 RepID=A0A0H2RZW2_9AGAM|nr:hypothetical protein SCHPADRAFT_996134 [Schizopora paradoxa]
MSSSDDEPQETGRIADARVGGQLVRSQAYEAGRDANPDLEQYSEVSRLSTCTAGEALEGALKGYLPLVKLLSDEFPHSLSLLKPNVVKVLFSHLDASKVPSFDFLPPSTAYTEIGDGAVTFLSQDIERARTVIWGFKDVYYGEECFDLAGGWQSFAPVLLSSWFGIYRWIEYFFQAVIEMDLGDDDFKLSFIEGSIHLFVFFSWIDEVHDFLARTSGAMTLLTKIWLQHHRFPKADPLDSLTLMNLIRPSKKREINEMAEAVDGGALALVQEILEPFREFLSSPSSILECRILSLLPVFTIYACRPRNALCRELLMNNGVRELIKSYLHCITNPMSFKGRVCIVEAPGDIFEFFGELWKSTPGHTWVVQAFRSGLLELFIRCWDFFPAMDEDINEEVTDGFLEFSMRYLVVLPVLQAASAAIREVHDKLDTKTRIALAPPRVSNAWRKFEYTVNDLLQIGGNLIEFRLEKFASICDFCIGYAGEVKKCQGCERAFYCSRKCQAQAWNSDGGHRAVCKTSTLINNGLNTDVHREMLLKVAMKELERNIDALLRTPVPSLKSFPSTEEVESIGILIFLAYPRRAFMKSAVPGDDWLENDDVVYEPDPNANRSTLSRVKLSKKATASLKVAMSRGMAARVERYEVPNFWAALKGDGVAKETPKLWIVRAVQRLDDNEYL